MKKLHIVELMGGMGIATQACKNNAGSDNVQIESYIDNDMDSVKVYNEYFGTNFSPIDINCFDFKNTKKDVDIAFVSFPSNTFRDIDVKDYNQHRVDKLFDVFIRRNSLDESVQEFVSIALPKCIVIDYTFIAKKCNRPKIVYSKCFDLESVEQYNFYNFLRRIEKIGYNVFCNTYNAACFNTPQNRERISIVCFRKDIDNSNFKFPIGTRTNKVLVDYKVKNYPDKYVLTDEQIDIINNTRLGKENRKQANYTNRYVYDDTLITFISASYGFNKGWSPIVKCDKGSGWRLLLPIEIFRFMGLSDDFYYFVSSIIDNDNSLYKLGGNAMIGTYYNELLRNILNTAELRCWE